MTKPQATHKCYECEAKWHIMPFIPGALQAEKLTRKLGTHDCLNSTEMRKIGGRPRGCKGKPLTLYLSHEVADYLKETGCASQVVEDLVRQFELPQPVTPKGDDAK